jgi:hypothetical protein
MGIKPHSKNSPTRIKATRRRMEALKWREKGLTFDAIGDKMGISGPVAYKLVKAAYGWLQQRMEERASDVLTLECSRLDALFKSYFDKAKAGDLKAAGLCLKVIERRQSLLGLNLVKHEVKVQNEFSVNVLRQIDAYASELEAGPQALPCHLEGDDSGQRVDQAGADQAPGPVPGV